MFLPDPFELKQVLEGAAAIVTDAMGLADLKICRKADGSPVTEVDRQVNFFLRAALARIAPESAWLSEEDAANPSRLSAKYCWIVDPLDGTTDFISGRAEFAVSVALVHGGTPVAAAIMNPATGEGGAWAENHEPIFWGWAMQSARCGTPPLDDARIVISRGETDRGTAAMISREFTNVSVVGSAAYKLLRVAARTDDLYVSMEPKSEWDICAGVGLLNGMDMTYRLFSGEPVRFNQPQTRIRSGAVGGAPTLVEAFLRRLGSAVQNSVGDYRH